MTKTDYDWFPDLNHLFIKVEGNPTGAEYGLQGRVDSAVIRAIGEWIDAESRRQ